MSARGGRRPGAGRPPIAGTPRYERLGLTLTEAERAEIEAAVPEGHPVGRWVADAALDRARSSPPELRARETGTDSCACGHAPEEHGGDPRYPAATGCSECQCWAYEADPLPQP